MPRKNISISHKNCYIDDRGFLFFELLEQDNFNTLTIKELNKIIQFVSKICENNYLPFFVDLRGASGKVKNQTLKLLAKDLHLKSVCSQIAFLVSTPQLKLSIYNYIDTHNPKVNTSVFMDYDECLNYCLALILHEKN